MNTDRKILAVDNDENALYNLRQEIKDIYPSAKIAAFCEVTQVLTYLNEQEHRKLDYAFLDTCLCGLPGIELARVIREYNPKTKIIFCTEHSENALEAFSVHAAAYLLKPITEDKLRRELNELERMNEEIPEPPRLVVHTFGNFEAFWKGRPLDWERDKAKELLAYLVDRRGAAVSSAEIALVLLGDDAKVRNVQTIISSLRKTLNSVGAGDVLIKRRNRTAIDVSKIQCDMYDFLDGDTRAEREPLEKADEQENQRSGGAHGGQRPVSEEPPDDERVRGVVELLENLAQKNRQRKACDQPPRAALRHIPRCALQGVSAPFCRKF